MFIRLSFQQKVETQPAQNSPLKRTSVILNDVPVIVNELPDGVKANEKYVYRETSRNFYYFLKCNDVTQEELDEVVKQFINEYKNDPDARYIGGVAPDKIPAIITMNDILRRARNDRVNHGCNKTSEVDKDDVGKRDNAGSFYSYRGLLFAGAVVAVGVVAAAVVNNRKSV